ncbi:MAG: DUF4910 domain-containing protein [Gammaproteobacteria bacterium]
MADEVSGDLAKTTVEQISQFHRMRGSKGFDGAAELVASKARAYGLENVEILQFPADGKIFYGTQRSRPAWEVEEGELAEVSGGTSRRIASYAANPIVLAQDSQSADVTAALVDVGDGSKESDYEGKDVAGKIVLVSTQAGNAQELAVGKYHAAGIVSYAQNQQTAWSGTNDDLIRWGHLKVFSAHPTFGFMISLRTARGLQARLASGEQITLHARVKAEQRPGFYEIVTATIEGADPVRKAQEVAITCHLDHPRPSANDNASGCAAILEVARTLRTLIASGKLPRPARTLRFIWSPEVEGAVTLLNARRDLAASIKALVFMDMVGGSPDTKAVFHMTRGPESLPSFIHDVAWTFAAWLNRETYEYASRGVAEYPVAEASGGREPLRAEYSVYDVGSDQDVYQDSSFGIPTVYMNDWPDRYIHTNFDTVANIDTTKLKRAAFIGATVGYFLSSMSTSDVASVDRAMAIGSAMRMAMAIQRGATPAAARTSAAGYEQAALASRDVFLGAQPKRAALLHSLGRSPGAVVYRRASAPKGPLAVFGYDYFAEHAHDAGIEEPRLLSFRGAWGGSDEYVYELLNFADGHRTAQQICDALSAEYGPVPLDVVVEYLLALKQLGIVEAL